ncbi:hypothetical protein GGR19_001468 [Croceicoccus naphthovorans]|nr:hypothetical protein [Croceicoccus naphthovorans]
MTTNLTSHVIGAIAALAFSGIAFTATLIA